jgi:LPS sulfotransferase NodH
MNIVVCTTARSGSNWFRDELMARGYPECSEWLHPNEPMYSEQFKPKIRQAKKEKKDFGIKIFISHLRRSGLTFNETLAKIDNPPNVFIRLRRKHLQKQAKSLANANITDRWFQSTQHEGKANESQIRKCRENLKKENMAWDDLLRGRDFLVVYYEDMVDDIDREMARVVEYIESKR